MRTSNSTEFKYASQAAEEEKIQSQTTNMKGSFTNKKNKTGLAKAIGTTKEERCTH